MHAIFEQIGFIGAAIAGAAYLPQIIHMFREKCTYGLSLKAFSLWCVSSVMITAHAIAIAAPVFITLGVIQIVATSIIVGYTITHKDAVCTFHNVATIVNEIE